MLSRDQTAIAGIGWTAFSRRSGASTKSLAAEASCKSIADAGLAPRDVDGVMSWYYKSPDGVSPVELGAAMSLDCPFELNVNAGGHWMCGAVPATASLVASGVCKRMLLHVVRNSFSEGRGCARRAMPAPRPQRREPGVSGEEVAQRPLARAGLSRGGLRALGWASGEASFGAARQD